MNNIFLGWLECLISTLHCLGALYRVSIRCLVLNEMHGVRPLILPTITRSGCKMQAISPNEIAASNRVGFLVLNLGVCGSFE